MNINSPVLAMQFKRFVSSRHFRNTVLPKLLSRLTPNKPRFIKLFLLVLLLEVSWIVVTVLQELNNPTLYTSSMVELSEYSAHGTDEGKDRKHNRRLYFWDQRGFTLSETEKEFVAQIVTYMQNKFSAEYTALKTDARKILLEDTLPQIYRRVRFMQDSGVWLNKSKLEKMLTMSHTDIAPKVSQYVNFHRYTWHGYNKTLAYNLYKTSFGQYKVFFVSFSDAAEKIQFVEHIALPTLLFLR